MKVIVQNKRHIAKTISYRILSTSAGFIFVCMTTGSLKAGTLFSFAELIFKPVVYYLHERVWYKYILFGVKSVPEEQAK